MKYCYSLIILVLIFSSCGKDITPNGSSIVIGDNSGLIVTNHSLSVISSGFGNLKTEELDLDGDGQLDLRFKSIISGSQQFGLFYAYNIESMHSNCNIAGVLENDTTWIMLDTAYLDAQGGGTYVYWERNRACTQIDASYTQFEVGEDELETVLYQSGGMININDHFDNDISYLLAPEDNTSIPQLETTSNDTLFYSVVRNLNEICTPATDDVAGYLGFKLNTSDGAKLGWVKFSITNGYIVMVKESAIQP